MEDVTGAYYIELRPPVPITVLEHTYDVRGGDDDDQQQQQQQQSQRLQLKIGIVKIHGRFECRIFVYMVNNGGGIATAPTNYVSLSVSEFRKIVEDDDFEAFFKRDTVVVNVTSKIEEAEITCKVSNNYMRIAKTIVRFLGENYVDITRGNWLAIREYYEESLDDLLYTMSEEWAEIATQTYEELFTKLLRHYIKHKDLEVTDVNTRTKLKNFYYKAKAPWRVSATPNQTYFSTTIMSLLISTYYHKLTLKAFRTVSYIRRGGNLL